MHSTIFSLVFDVFCDQLTSTRKKPHLKCNIYINIQVSKILKLSWNDGVNRVYGQNIHCSLQLRIHVKVASVYSVLHWLWTHHTDGINLYKFNKLFLLMLLLSLLSLLSNMFWQHVMPYVQQIRWTKPKHNIINVLWFCCACTSTILNR